MKQNFNTSARNLLLIVILLGIYWTCEAFFFTRLYPIAPVAIVTGAVSLISFIVGMITGKTWVVLSYPTMTILTMTGLAVVSVLLRGEVFF